MEEEEREGNEVKSVVERDNWWESGRNQDEQAVDKGRNQDGEVGDKVENQDGNSGDKVESGKWSGISMEVPLEYKGTSNGELIEYLKKRRDEYAPLDKKQIEKLRKRQRAQGIISGISDAVSSISNLIFASKGAPSMYEPGNGMSERMRARWEREKKEREESAAKRLNIEMAISKLENEDRDRGLQTWMKEQELLRGERKYEDSKRNEGIDALIKKYQADYYKERAEKEKSDAEKSRVQAEMEADKITSIINRNNRSGVKGSVSRSKKGGKTYTLETPDGVKTYSNAEEYKAAVYAAAEEYGIEGMEYMETVYSSGKSVARDRKRSVAELAGELQSKGRRKNGNEKSKAVAKKLGL